jgi:hypothetical protein
MGLLYYQVDADKLTALVPLIRRHEAEIVGPRARGGGMWFDRPEDFDYDGVRATAQELAAAARDGAHGQLELSEVAAHSLAFLDQLDISVPSDRRPLPPAPFLCSVGPRTAAAHMQAVRQRLGAEPVEALRGLLLDVQDRRVAGYFQKQLRTLQRNFGDIWQFYGQAVEAGHGVVVVDLRARDLWTPDPVELAEPMYG